METCECEGGTVPTETEFTTEGEVTKAEIVTEGINEYWTNNVFNNQLEFSWIFLLKIYISLLKVQLLKKSTFPIA